MEIVHTLFENLTLLFSDPIAISHLSFALSFLTFILLLLVMKTMEKFMERINSFIKNKSETGNGNTHLFTEVDQKRQGDEKALKKQNSDFEQPDEQIINSKCIKRRKVSNGKYALITDQESYNKLSCIEDSATNPDKKTKDYNKID